MEIRAPFVSVEQTRESSVMSPSDGDASLPQIAKKTRTDISALAHTLLPMARNLQASATRA